MDSRPRKKRKPVQGEFTSKVMLGATSTPRAARKQQGAMKNRFGLIPLEYLSPESRLLVEGLTPQYFWSSSAYSQKQPSGERERERERERARAHGPKEAAFVRLRSARTEEIWWLPAQGLGSQGLEPDCLHANLVECAAFESNSGQCY